MVVTFERDRGNRSMDKRFRCKARSVKYTARLERESWREGGALIQPADLKGDFSGLRVAANRRCAPVIGLHPPIAPRYFHPFHDCYVPTIHPIDRARSIDSNWLTDILSAKLANFKLAGWTRSSGRNIPESRSNLAEHGNFDWKESRCDDVIDDTRFRGGDISQPVCSNNKKEKRNCWYHGFRIQFTFSNSIEAAHLGRRF